MKLISSYVNVNEMKSQTKWNEKRGSNSSNISNANFAKLYLAFKAHYEALWADKFIGTEASKLAKETIWKDALADLTMLDIDRALSAINRGETEFSKFPPKPGEFAALARSLKPRAYDVASDDFLALPRFANPELAKSSLAEIRAKLCAR